MLIYPSSLAETQVPSIRRVAHVHPENKIRLDTWIEVEKRQGGYLKISHFGEKEKDKIKVNDFIYTRFDERGEIQDFTSSVMSYGYLNGGYPSQKPWNFVDPDGVNITIKKNEPISGKPEIDLASLYSEVVTDSYLIDNRDIPLNTEIFEDTMNLPFTIYGYILAALSVAAMHVPYHANVIIDSSIGFNLLDIQIDSKYPVKKDFVKGNIANFIQFLSFMNKGFRDICRREDATIRVYGHIYPYGAVVEILHRELNNISFRNHINISDHCRILRTIESRDQSFYFNSPLFEALNMFGYPSAISSTFDSREEREGFARGYITENFVSDWEGGEKIWQRKMLS